MDIQKLTVTTKPFKIILIFLNDVPFNYIQHKILKKTAEIFYAELFSTLIINVFWAQNQND